MNSILSEFRSLIEKSRDEISQGEILDYEKDLLYIVQDKNLDKLKLWKSFLEKQKDFFTTLKIYYTEVIKKFPGVRHYTSYFIVVRVENNKINDQPDLILNIHNTGNLKCNVNNLLHLSTLNLTQLISVNLSEQILTEILTINKILTFLIEKKIEFYKDCFDEVKTIKLATISFEDLTPLEARGIEIYLLILDIICINKTENKTKSNILVAYTNEKYLETILDFFAGTKEEEILFNKSRDLFLALFTQSSEKNLNCFFDTKKELFIETVYLNYIDTKSYASVIETYY